jgi:uncharacterized damage-inducible protein DinB
MSESLRIADQLKRSMRGVAWHGPSVLEILEDVTPEEALRRPVPQAHSIAELVLHITAWIQEVTRALDSRVARLTTEQDWPAVPQPFDWPSTLERLREASKHLGDRVKSVRDADLDTMVGGHDQDYPTYALLHGVVQHNIYHAGQLSLLKKALRGS